MRADLDEKAIHEYEANKRILITFFVYSLLLFVDGSSTQTLATDYGSGLSGFGNCWTPVMEPDSYGHGRKIVIRSIPSRHSFAAKSVASLRCNCSNESWRRAGRSQQVQCPAGSPCDDDPGHGPAQRWTASEEKPDERKRQFSSFLSNYSPGRKPNYCFFTWSYMSWIALSTTLLRVMFSSCESAAVTIWQRLVSLQNSLLAFFIAL